MKDGVLVLVENVRKKFCRDLKKSLWYGVQDVFADLNPFARNGSALGKDRDFLTRNHQLRPDEFWAVNEVSFEVRRGECLGLIGHNGAGKTTLLKMLNGLIKPDHGRIEMRGRVVALIALGAGFNPILSGRENIYVNGSILGLTSKAIDDRMEGIIDFAEIRDFIEAPVQSYSSGMQVRLGFAIAAHCQPDILLLDEVLAVGDISFQAKCFNTLSEFRKKGTALILVSHNIHQISRYCDQVVYLRRGRIAHFGDVASGINQFSRDINSPDSGTENELTDWSKVYGSAKVVLKKATFLNEAAEEIDEIKPDDTFSLAIDYECPGEDVEDAVLDLLIRDKGGVFFQGTSDNYGATFGRLPRHGRLIVTFDRLPANAPQVQFSFALFGRRTLEMYDWKTHIRLKVDTNSRLTGRVALGITWTSVPFGRL